MASDAITPARIESLAMSLASGLFVEFFSGVINVSYRAQRQSVRLKIFDFRGASASVCATDARDRVRPMPLIGTWWHSFSRDRLNLVFLGYGLLHVVCDHRESFNKAAAARACSFWW